MPRFLGGPGVEAIDLLTKRRVNFMDYCSSEAWFFSFHSCGYVFLFISLSRTTSLDSRPCARTYDGNTQHNRLYDVFWIGPLVLKSEKM